MTNSYLTFTSDIMNLVFYSTMQLIFSFLSPMTYIHFGLQQHVTTWQIFGDKKGFTALSPSHCGGLWGAQLPGREKTVDAGKSRPQTVHWPGLG